MKTVIYNIGTLAGILPEGKTMLKGEEMNHVECIENAYLTIEDGIITDFGPDNSDITTEAEYIDAKGGFVMPAFCDAHTHIVYAGCRDGEFRDKIAGMSYEEIAARGGGILNSADLLHETSEEELYRQSMERVNEIMAMGTGAVEIKSGYGLTLEDELKMLRVIRRIKETTPLTIKSTFLGAHAVGRAYKGRQGDYVEHICKDMLPAVAAENLAVLETAAMALEMANLALEEQNDNLLAVNNKLKKENASLKSKVASVDQIFRDMGPATLYFDMGKTVLSEKELQHLDFLATNLLAKINKNTKIYITVLGTADGTTGSEKRNQYLSKTRGTYMYNLLTTKYGIAPDRIVVKSEVVKSPEHPELSRAVVIKF